MAKMQQKTDNFYKDGDGVRAKKTAVQEKNEKGGLTMSTGRLFLSVNICIHLSRGCVPLASRWQWLGHTSIRGFVTVINSSFYHL